MFRADTRGTQEDHEPALLQLVSSFLVGTPEAALILLMEVKISWRVSVSRKQLETWGIPGMKLIPSWHLYPGQAFDKETDLRALSLGVPVLDVSPWALLSIVVLHKVRHQLNVLS